MFDLFRSREKMTKYFLGAILLVVCASMVTYLIPNTDFMGNGVQAADTVIAEVDGDKITTQDVQTAMERMGRSGQLPPEVASLYLPQVVDQLVQERASIAEFAKQGLSVTDTEVLAGFMQLYPQLFQNGKLVSTDMLSQQLSGQGMTLQDGLDAMRKQLLIKKIQNITFASAVVTQQEVDQALINKHRTARVDYIAFPPAKFRDQIRPTPDELRKAYETSKANYMIPERKSFDLIVADQSKIEQSVTIPDAQLRTAYANAQDNFRSPERTKARHILVMTQGKPEAEKKTLRAKAEDLLKQLKGGADFAELAKKNSDDPGSAQHGGDLGFFGRGQMVPEFDKYAFSGKIGEISPIVETTFGYHIIQVTERQAAHVKPFEEVKESIAKELKQQTVNDKLQQVADQAHAALVKAPGSAAEIAKQFDLQFINVKDAKAGDAIPGIGASNEIAQALSPMKVNDVSDEIVIPGNKIAILTLKDLVPARPSNYAEVEEQVRSTYIATNSEQTAAGAAQDAAKRIKAGESLEAVAKSMKLEVTNTKDFTSTDNVDGIGNGGLLPDAFNKPIGTIVGPFPAEGRNVIYRVAAHSTVDPAQYSFERDSAYQELKQAKAKTAYDLLEDSMLANAKAKKNLKIYDDRVRRLAATYQNSR